MITGCKLETILTAAVAPHSQSPEPKDTKKHLVKPYMVLQTSHHDTKAQLFFPRCDNVLLFSSIKLASQPAAISNNYISNPISNNILF